MDDKIKRDNDAYDELLRSFSSSKANDTSDNDVKNHGEIYFSVNANKPQKSKTQFSVNQYQNSQRQNVQAQKTQAQEKIVNATVNSTTQAKNQNTNVNKNTKMSTASKKERAKNRKKKNAIQNALLAVAIVCIVFISAFLLKIPIMGCINDILAIDVSNTDMRVVLDNNMNAYEVIDELAEKDLINNPMFCKLFVNITGLYQKTDKNNKKKTINYPAGTYFLNSSMGVEGMLLEIRSNGSDDNTIKLTFPEGYNIDQIFEKLDDNGVCSADSLYKTMENEEFIAKYDFLSQITDKNLRYRLLEGYLYPDTYEFYIGEAPTSVLERFLNNFEDKWSDAYNSTASELGYTIDEIITVATILEKEAFDSEQMPIIASVLYNRLNSSSFPFINCDSTAQYIDNCKDYIDNDVRYNELMKVYDTYQKTGLPVGPICCPGADAIHAALYPASTDYYYFLHDDEGNIYLASTAQEHQNNLQYLG